MRFTADVKGGLHANYSPTIASMGPNVIDHQTRRAQQSLNTKGEYVFRKLLEMLIGATPGATAQYVYPEIQANVEMGGPRVIVNTNLVNRATTAADVTDLKNALVYMTTLTTMASPYNGDRNPLGTR